MNILHSLAAMIPKYQKVETTCAFFGYNSLDKTRFIRTMMGLSTPKDIEPIENTGEYIMKFFARESPEAKSKLIVLNVLDIALRDLNKQILEVKIPIVVFMYDVNSRARFSKMANDAKTWLRMARLDPRKAIVVGLEHSTDPKSSDPERVSLVDVFRFRTQLVRDSEDFQTSLGAKTRWIENEFKTHLMKTAFACVWREKAQVAVDMGLVSLDMASFDIVPDCVMTAFHLVTSSGLSFRSIVALLVVCRMILCMSNIFF